MPEFVWLGGFGFSGAATTSHLGINASLDGGEIEVDTATAQRWARSPGMEQRHRIADVIWHHLHAHEDELTLPLDLRIEPEGRTIRVDGFDRLFAGPYVAGSSRWSGSCLIDDVRITVTMATPAVVKAIAASDCHDLDDNPPPLQ